MALEFEQVKLLLWKNFILKKRRWILLILEFILELGFTAVLVIVRNSGSVKFVSATMYPNYSTQALPAYFLDANAKREWELVYIPSNSDIVKELIKMVQKTLLNKLTIHGFTSEELFEKYIKYHDDSDRVMAAVVFNHDFASVKDLPLQVSYHLRFRYSLRNTFVTTRLLMIPKEDFDWNTDHLFPMYPSSGPRNPLEDDGGTPGYIREGFLAVQNAVDKAIIFYHANDSAQRLFDSIDVYAKRFPFPSFFSDNFLTFLGQIWPPMILLTFSLKVFTILYTIVWEKETRLKEYLLIMGLRSWQFWCATFLTFFSTLLVSIILMTIALFMKDSCKDWVVDESLQSGFICTSITYPMVSYHWTQKKQIVKLPVIHYSDPTLVFSFLLLYGITTVLFAFMLTTFFNKGHWFSTRKGFCLPREPLAMIGDILAVAIWKVPVVFANTAITIGGFIYFVSYLLYFVISPHYVWMTFHNKLFSCLLSNVAMVFGVNILIKLESLQIGVQWKNLKKPLILADNFTFGHVMLMLLVDAFLYSVVIWYVEAVFPRDYGVPYPWYFFGKYSYWKENTTSILRRRRKHLGVKRNSEEFFEPEPENLMASIQMKNLTKIFDVGHAFREAVTSLTLNLYEGQITALLGQNGAGKTTILSLLSGVFPPTRGNAYVCGFDISKDLVHIRKSFSLCPQNDLLFDHLTVSEHLYFFARLKGLPWDICHNEINNALNFFKLQDKRHSFPNSLSGGMKRKLCISIALTGNPKVVMLDAPTTGMDSVSKKATWTLLQQQKYGRTILLATPSVDEADLLADRIAIIVKGNLQCCGSSMFLRQKYGIGYNMVVVQEPHSKEATQITSLIYNYVPNAILQSHVGSELSFILPKDYANRFADLFNELKNQQLRLGIASYGASFATMEEVFLRVIQLTDSMVDLQAIHLPTKRDRNKVQRYLKSWDNKSKSESLMSVDLSNIQFNTGIVLCIQQFYALLIKRALYTFRHWKITVLQILILLIFTAFFLKIIFDNSEVKDSPSLGMDLHKYGQSIVPYTSSLGTELGNRFSDHMKLILANEKQLPQPVTGNMEEYLLKSRSCKEQCLVAVSLDVQEKKAVFTALFNNQAYHTAPTALNLVNNILFKLLSGPGASISVANKPQPPTASQKLKKQLHKGIKGHDVAFSLFFGTAIVASSFSLLTISERVCKAKHIQFVSGAHMGIFWLSALVWDVSIFFICSFLLLGVFYICQVDVFFEGNNYTDVLLILMLFGWSIVPFIYLMSFLFSNSAAAYTKLLAFNLLTGIASFFLVHMIDTNMMNLGHFNQILVSLFFLFPTHNLGKSISGLYDKFQAQKYCTRFYGDCAENNIKSKQTHYGLEGHGIGKYVIAMIVTGFLFLILLFIVEVNLLKIRSFSSTFLYGNFLKKRKMAQVGHQSSLESDDESLINERSKVLKSTTKKRSSLNSPLILKELLKIYFQPVPLVAVDRFTLTIDKGECWGLLGLNGAGKSSVFKMLTGDSIITSGKVLFEDKNIGKNTRQIHQRISYCPQHDPLLEHLTGYEMLALHARLWGVPEPCLPGYIKNTLSTLSLGAFEDELIMNFSSGTKRKLSICIALLGRPDIIFLNKPSSSMDSVAQRFLWDMISRIRESCKATVIIPHSLEECEALCTRLAFMENGKLKCLGSPQYLKNKFGSRYKLLAKIKRNKSLDELQELKTFIQTTFADSSLLHECQRTVHYHIPSKSLTLGKVFDILESNKDKYGLEAYSISHNTLEKVFLNFTQIQTEQNYKDN